MRMLNGAGLALAMWMATVSTAAAEVRVTIQNGRISLVAKDVTVRQILTEWARVGQTTLVNPERMTGGPVSLELTNVPKKQALEVLLRSASGYVLASRAIPEPNLSQFDRILLMPPSAVPRAAAGPEAAVRPPPQRRPPQRRPPNDDDTEPPGDAPALAPPNGPVFNMFPPPQLASPDQQNGQQPGQGAPFQPRAPFQAASPSPGTLSGPLPQQPATAPRGSAQPPSSSAPFAPFGGTARPGEVAPPPPTPTQSPSPSGSPSNRPQGN